MLAHMKLSPTLEAAFNQQVTAEFEASMVYRQLAYALDDFGLVGMRDWMHAQANEELEHAQQFAEHMLNRGSVPQIGTIEGPKLTINSAVDAFEAALAHEQKISGMIRKLAIDAQNEQDMDSRPLLDTFLAEQILEESHVNEILDRLRLVGADGSGILRMDAELGARPEGEIH